MSYASDKIGNEIVGMSSYGSKTLCPCEACKKARAAEQGQYDHECGSTCASDGCVCECHTEQTAQPPAGDVVERMCEAFDNEGGTYNYRQAMAAALAVEKQERDAQWEKAIRHEMPSEFTDLGIDTFVATLRARLAKPAERVTDQGIIETILWKKKLSLSFVMTQELAAEIVAALRDGKEGK